MKTRILILVGIIGFAGLIVPHASGMCPSLPCENSYIEDKTNLKFIDFSYSNTVGEPIQFILEKARDSNCNSYNAKITDDEDNFILGWGTEISCDPTHFSNSAPYQTKIGYNENKPIIINESGKYYLEVEFDDVLIKREFVVRQNHSGVSLDRTAYHVPWMVEPPLKQFKSGITYDEIQCNGDLVLIQKYDGSPTCVKSETVPKLIEREWTKDEITMLAKTNSNNQKLIELLESGQVSEFNNLKETMDLSHVQVSLEGADLQGIDLRKINLERVHIEYANLKDANLQGIVLDYRNIQYTDLQGANLSNVDISDTYLYDVNLQGANLTGASMKNTHIYDSNMNHANLKDTDLRGVNFQAASVIGTNFQDADLQGALMAETNLKKLNFDGANMQFVNLKYADLHNASLQNANMQNTNLENTNLRGANLSGADLQGANLNNADLLETNLSNVQNLPISKEEARQRGAITE